MEGFGEHIEQQVYGNPPLLAWATFSNNYVHATGISISKKLIPALKSFWSGYGIFVHSEA